MWSDLETGARRSPPLGSRPSREPCLAVLLEGGYCTQAADERRIHRLVRSAEQPSPVPVLMPGRSPWTF